MQLAHVNPANILGARTAEALTTCLGEKGGESRENKLNVVSVQYLICSFVHAFHPSFIHQTFSVPSSRDPSMTRTDMGPALSSGEDRY